MGSADLFQDPLATRSARTPPEPQHGLAKTTHQCGVAASTNPTARLLPCPSGRGLLSGDSPPNLPRLCVILSPHMPSTCEPCGRTQSGSGEDRLRVPAGEGGRGHSGTMLPGGVVSALPPIQPLTASSLFPDCSSRPAHCFLRPPLFSPPLAWPLEGHAQEFWNVPWTDTPKSTSCQHLTPGAPNPEGGLHSSSPVWCLSGLSPLRPRSSPQAEGVLKAQAPACLCCCQPCLHWS